MAETKNYGSITRLSDNRVGQKWIAMPAGGLNPTGGPYDPGDTSIALDGYMWVCIVAGTPGTWQQVGTGFLNGPVNIVSSSATALTVAQVGITNPIWQVDASTASQAAGLKLTGATSAGTVALGVISSGAAANLTIDAKGTGTVGINTVGTGGITLGQATTITTGNLTVTNGNLVFGAASSKIIPGATSLLFQDASNANTNVSITDAGLVTVRAGLTATAGNVAITAGNLTFGAASAKIIPGATSLLFRDNADANTNVSITDAGVVTIRGGIVISGGGIAVTGNSTFAGTVTITSADPSAFAVGRLGATTPAFVIDASTATSITGMKVKSAASGGGVAVTSVGETNVALSINTAGSGGLTLNTAGTTGSVTIGNTTGNTAVTGALVGTSASANAFAVGRLGSTTPAFNVDASTGTSITGVNVKAAATGGNVTLSAIGETNVSLLLAGIGTGVVQTTAITTSATVGAFKAINSTASGVGMAVMLSNLAANNTANAIELGFSANNSTPAEIQYGAIRVTSTNVTAGATEQGTMILRTRNAGSLTTMLQLDNNGLTFGLAASQIIPGATSIALRNNANNANNLIITDAGAATFRSTVGGITTLTATSAAFTGNVTFSGATRSLWTSDANEMDLGANATAIIKMTSSGGVQIGSPTGGDKGTGTLNATNLYIAGVAVSNGITMIADNTLGSDTASVTFSGIAGSYKHLVIIMQTRGDGALVAEYVRCQYNSDTGGNYDNGYTANNNVVVTGNSSLAATSAFCGVEPGASAVRASITGASTITIPNYAGTTFEKSAVWVTGVTDSTAANNFNTTGASSWRSTAAITAIKLFPQSSTNFKTGSRFTLYGYS